MVAQSYPANFPMVMLVPQSAPLARSAYQDTNFLQDQPTARYQISFEDFQSVQGDFQTQTVTGSASFYQNPFTGTNSKYRIDLTGLTAGDIYVIGLQADCNQNMVKVGYNLSLADPQLSLVHSHWSSSYITVLSLVETFIVLLAPAVLCHKEPACRI